MLAEIAQFFLSVFVVFYLVRGTIPRSSEPIRAEPSAKSEHAAHDEDDFLQDDDLFPPTSSGPDLAANILARYASATFHDPKRTYLPENAIKELIVQASIEQELAKIEHKPTKGTIKYDRHYRSQLAGWVREEAPKIFGITIQCDLGAHHLLLAMMTFKRFKFNDKSLPLVDASPSDIFPEKLWTPTKLDNFLEKQWKYLVPVFKRSEYDYDLKAECIFPFTSDGVVPKDGAFSSVYRVAIHEHHHEFSEIQKVRNC
jgi:hypothetical protein